jgi:hypothetical protein
VNFADLCMASNASRVGDGKNLSGAQAVLSAGIQAQCLIGKRE